MKPNWKKVKFSDVFKQYRIEHIVKDELIYKQVTISSKGYVEYRTSKIGKDIGRKRQFLVDLKSYPNTLLFTRQGIVDGAIGFAPQSVDGAIVTENMPMFSLNDDVNENYIKEFIKSAFFANQIKLLTTTGSAQKSIHEKQISELEILLPNNINEQDTIAKALSKTNVINNKILRATQAQSTILTSLRQQILQDAITGKLSEKWRKENPNIESAEILLGKIKAEKEKLIKEGKIRKQKPLPSIAVNEIPFKLPEGWVWCNGNLASDYIDPQPSHRTPVESTDGIPYVAMSNINEDGTINFSSCRKVSKGILDEHQRRYQIKNGDFVIGKIGTIGNPTILPLPQNYTLSANIVLIQPRTDVAMPLFLYYLLKSPFYISKMIESKSEMSYPVFGIKKMRLIIIPLPPLAEQQYIVERIESLFAKLDRIKELNTEDQTNIDLLNQVVLKEMFEE